MTHQELRTRMAYQKKCIALSHGLQRIEHTNRYRQLKRQYRAAWYAEQRP